MVARGCTRRDSFAGCVGIGGGCGVGSAGLGFARWTVWMCTGRSALRGMGFDGGGWLWGIVGGACLCVCAGCVALRLDGVACRIDGLFMIPQIELS